MNALQRMHPAKFPANLELHQQRALRKLEKWLPKDDEEQ
jgi:hypothetical protein